MARRSLGRRAVALGAALALAAPAAAQARDLYATDDRGNLLRFDTRFPGLIQDRTPITGLPAGVSLVGIDVRPATGDLIGVGSNSVVYRVDANTGATGAIGTGFNPGLAGGSFGVDVNPVPDALRITGDSGQNLRISFATGNHGAGSPDGALNPGSPNVVASAYTSSVLSATRPASTTLYAIDAATNQLLVQNPPNAGTLVDPKPLGVDAGPNTGFDIAGGLGYMVTTPAGGTGAVLYRVDLGTGQATRLGPVGTGRLLARQGTPRLTITGLAARQSVGAPLAANIPPQVSIVRTTLQPRPGQRAAYIARATDPDGAVTRVEWDTTGDGSFTNARGQFTRIGLPAGLHTIGVRVTDDAGARTTETIQVRITR